MSTRATPIKWKDIPAWVRWLAVFTIVDMVLGLVALVWLNQYL